MSQIERKLGAKEVRVDLSSATLSDCGAQPVAPKDAPAEKPSGDRAADCTSSVQISIRAGEKAAAAKIRVKSVELYDDGKVVAKLGASAPLSWSESGQYEKWNEKAVAGKTLSASYTLTEPNWASIADYRSKTFRIRVVLTVGGTEQSMERDVSLHGEVELPPDVVT